MNTAAKSSQHVRALAALLLANLFWGLSFPLIKAAGALQAHLSPAADSWFVTACTLVPRFALGAVIVAVLCRGSIRTLSRLELQQGLALGLFALVGMIFQNDGLHYTSASTSAFLTQLYAILIPVWLALRARRSPPWTVWVSCALVLGGVAVLAELDFSDLRLGRGELETLVSSVFFMGQILQLDRPAYAQNRALHVTLVMFVVEAVGAGVMAWSTAPTPGDLLVPWTSIPWITFMLALTLFCTVGAYVLMNTWQPKITATEAGLIYCFEPVFTSVMALFLPAWFAAWGGFLYANETLTKSLLIGGGLITAANILIQLKPLSRPPPSGSS